MTKPKTKTFKGLLQSKAGGLSVDLLCFAGLCQKAEELSLKNLVILLVLGLTVISPAPRPVQKPPDTQEDFSSYDEMAFQIAQFLGSRMESTPFEELVEIGQWILDKSAENHLDPLLVLAVIHVESTFDKCAYSKYGAKGLMQVMPRRILTQEALEAYAFRHHIFYEPKWNIEFGTEYLASLVDRFGSLETALAAYNMGPTRVSRKKTDGSKTRYVRKVMGRYAKLQKTFNVG